MTKLIKVEQNLWCVEHNRTVKSFHSIEDASDFLIDPFEVHDEQIDEAICLMAAYGHNTAVFSEEGFLIKTELK